MHTYIYKYITKSNIITKRIYLLLFSRGDSDSTHLSVQTKVLQIASYPGLIFRVGQNRIQAWLESPCLSKQILVFWPLELTGVAAPSFHTVHRQLSDYQALPVKAVELAVPVGRPCLCIFSALNQGVSKCARKNQKCFYAVPWKEQGRLSGSKTLVLSTLSSSLDTLLLPTNSQQLCVLAAGFIAPDVRLEIISTEDYFHHQSQILVLRYRYQTLLWCRRIQVQLFYYIFP